MCFLGAKKISALIVGILTMLMAGSLYSFTVYAPCFQWTFNFTQQEIDLIPSFGHLGFCIGIPAGILYCKFGTMWMSVVGFIVSTVGYLLIWSSFLKPYVYHFKWWLIAIYYFVTGHGLVYLYMSGMITNMRNLPKRHRATVVGALDAVFGASSGLFILIYKSLFAQSFKSTGESDENLAGFMLFMSAACGLVGTISIVVLREHKDYSGRRDTSVDNSTPDVRDYTASALEYPGDESEASSVVGDNDSVPIVGTRPLMRRVTLPEDSTLPATQRTPEAETNLMGLALVKRADFHCLLWPFALMGAVCFVAMTNIEFVLKSFDLNDQTLICIIGMAITNGASRIICGLLSDRYVESVKRSNIWFFTLIPALVTTSFAVFFMHRALVVILWIWTIGLAYGAMWCLVPTMISELYGLKYFGINWGLVLLISAICSVALQLLFGYFYDYYASSLTLICMGTNCFRWSVGIFVGLIALSMAFVTVLSKLSES